jgi:hypothetical protein
MSTPHLSQVITRAVNKVLRPLTPSTPTIKPTTPTEVRHHIHSLKPRTAPGNDGISPEMLRHLPTRAIQHLTLLLNSIIKLGYFPTIWKAVKVIPTHQPNKPPKDANSYRPISLFSSISKILERIIASRLTTFVNQNHLIPDTQFGFRKKHSTVPQLARIVDYISHGYNHRKHTGMALLDLEKAYDTVWITGLLYKLIVLKVPEYLLFNLRSYLEECTYTVHINDVRSTPIRPPAGLPQGAVLSTTLFSLYIADIPHPPDTQLALYADDIAIFSQSWRSETITRRLNSTISQLLRYFNKWKLRVNVSKTELILFTKRRPLNPQPLQLQNVTIPWSNTVKYLGILLDSKLLFTKHLQTVRHKATGTFLKIVPLLSRDSPLTIPNKIILYKLLLRSMITYVAPVWSSTSLTNYRHLQIYLSKCLCVIGNFPRRTPISNLHVHLRIISIRQFAYHLTDKFFMGRPVHPNPRILNIGNYTLQDLRRQYTKYTHKRTKHKSL